MACVSVQTLVDCTTMHETTAEYIEKAEEIKGKGVDAIYCLASNDAFVVRLCHGGDGDDGWNVGLTRWFRSY